MSDSIYRYQISVTVSGFTVSDFVFLTHPFHNILSLVPSTALDLQPFVVTSGEMRCHVIMIHTD
jgi:hypothetical protein